MIIVLGLFHLTFPAINTSHLALVGALGALSPALDPLDGPLAVVAGAPADAEADDAVAVDAPPQAASIRATMIPRHKPLAGGRSGVALPLLG
jgi:hypothetical protein